MRSNATKAVRQAAVMHIPHSSTVIPDDVRNTLVPSDSALKRELLRLTDRYTHELFAPDSAIAFSVVFGVSRLVVDPERFTDDALEPMARRGMGAVYTATADGAPLRATLSASDRAGLLERFYAPHHAALEAAIEKVLDATGQCLVIDGHSFPDVPLPCDLNQDRPRPEICIGTDPFHTGSELAIRASRGFEANGLEVAVNRPYSGALVPARWWRRDARVSAVMIEINRRLYMDEATGDRTADFAEIARVVRSVVTGLITEAATA